MWCFTCGCAGVFRGYWSVNDGAARGHELRFAAERGLPYSTRWLLRRGQLARERDFSLANVVSANVLTAIFDHGQIGPNWPDPVNRATALHGAVINDLVPIARLLIARGADVNLCCYGDPVPLPNSPMDFAPIFGVRSAQMARVLVDAGAELNARSRGVGLLHALCRNQIDSLLEIMRVLIDAGADVNALRNGSSLCAVNSVVQALASLTFDIRSHLEPGEIHAAWTALISRHSDAARRHEALALSNEIATTLLGPNMTFGAYSSAHEVMDRVLGAMGIARRLIATNKRTCRNENCRYSAVETTPLSSVVSLKLERGGSASDALAGRRAVEQVELDSRSKEKSSCCGLTQVQQGGWLLHDTLDIANTPVLVIQLERTTAKYLKTADNVQLGDWSSRAIVVATPGHFYCYGARRLEWPLRRSVPTLVRI